MAKIIFRCFELSGSFKCCQFFSDWTSIGKSITWKILRVKKREIKSGKEIDETSSKLISDLLEDEDTMKSLADSIKNKTLDLEDKNLQSALLENSLSPHL